MNVQTVRLPQSQVSLDIEVESSAVGSAIDRAYQRLAQRYTVPGFRKGKAPRPVLEAAIGRSAIMEEAADIAVNDAYQQALQQTGLIPITNPEIDLQGNGVDPSQPLFFSAKFYVQPDVQLGDYRAIRVTPAKSEISDEEVEEALRRLAENDAPWAAVEGRGAAEGDLAIVILTGTVDGETVIDASEEEYLLGNITLTPTRPDLSAEIIEMSPGETKEVAVVLPEEFEPAAHAGKTMQCRIELQRLEHRVVPALDDAFARAVGEEYESIGALREQARRSLESQRRTEEADAFVAEVLQQAVDGTEVELPPPLIEDEIHRSLDNLKAEVESRRYMTFDLYLRIINKTMDQLHEEAHEPAMRRVKSNLVLEAVADAEGIAAPPAQIDADLREIAALPTVRERDRRRIMTSPTVRARIEARLKRRLALQRLLEIANPNADIADTTNSEGDQHQRALQEAAQSHADALENATLDPGEEEL